MDNLNEKNETLYCLVNLTTNSKNTVVHGSDICCSIIMQEKLNIIKWNDLVSVWFHEKFVHNR